MAVMKQSRFDSLSDGIFAIVITLLAFDLRVPDFGKLVTDQELWYVLVALTPIFISFILSFTLLFTYWRAHHYIASVYAKNVDTHLTNINAAFFFFITTIPFTSRLLGQYSNTHVAIILYGANVIAISLMLYWMRHHVLHSHNIDKEEISKLENARGLLRIIVPMFLAVLAILLCFFNTELSFVLFTFAIAFNLMSHGVTVVNWSVERVLHNKILLSFAVIISLGFITFLGIELYGNQTFLNLVHIENIDPSQKVASPPSAFDISTTTVYSATTTNDAPPIYLTPEKE